MLKNHSGRVKDLFSPSTVEELSLHLAMPPFSVHRALWFYKRSFSMWYVSLSFSIPSVSQMYHSSPRAPYQIRILYGPCVGLRCALPSELAFTEMALDLDCQSLKQRCAGGFGFSSSFWIPQRRSSVAFLRLRFYRLQTSNPPRMQMTATLIRA